MRIWLQLKRAWQHTCLLLLFTRSNHTRGQPVVTWTWLHRLGCTAHTHVYSTYTYNCLPLPQPPCPSQAPEPHSDARAVPASINWDLGNAALWEPVLDEQQTRCGGIDWRANGTDWWMMRLGTVLSGRWP